MIEEYGTIVEIKNLQIAVVKCQRNSACDHCPSSGACNIGDDGETMLIDAYNAVGAQLDDQVKIVTSTKHFLQSSFMLYIVPIIGLLVGALVGQTAAEQFSLGIDPSLFSAITAVIFLVITFFAIRLGTRSLKREAFMPHIVGIQSRTEL